MTDKKPHPLPWNGDSEMLYTDITGQRLTIRISQHDNDNLTLINGMTGITPTAFIDQAYKAALAAQVADLRSKNSEDVLQKAFNQAKEKRDTSRDLRAKSMAKKQA